MGAALALLILLAGSIFIIRVAAVALRLTGVPEIIARFQALSALTGAGFTTTESETIVDYPIRRKIIAALMFMGNLGLISVLSTFIVAFTNTDGNLNAIVFQAASMIGALVFIVVMMTNKTLDRVLCGIVERVLIKTTSLDKKQPYTLLLNIDDDHVVAEHSYRGKAGILIHQLLPPEAMVKLLWIKGSETSDYDHQEYTVQPHTILVFLGTIDAHHELGSYLKQLEE